MRFIIYNYYNNNHKKTTLDSCYCTVTVYIVIVLHNYYTGHCVQLLKVGLEMEENIQQLKIDFADIVVGACRWLRNRYPNAEDAAVWLNEALKGLQSEPLVVKGSVSDHSTLLEKLQEKWSFTNRTFLQQLIEKTVSRALIKKINKYEEHFKKVCDSITISNKAIQKEMIFEPYDESKPCLVIVITSVSHLDDIKVFLMDVFNIHERHLRIHKIASGCVEVSLQFEACMKPYIQGCVDKKCEEVKHYAKMYIEEDQVEIRQAQPQAVTNKVQQKKRRPTKAKARQVKMRSCRYTAQSKLGKHPHITEDTSKGYSLRKKAKRDMQ